MNEADSLIKRAKKYIHSAGELIKLEDFESSVSRAYYAMFFCAEAVLLNKGLAFSTHKGVISTFGKEFVKTTIFPREMGRMLNKAFGKRQLSDYEYTFVIKKEEAEEILDGAVNFLKEIEKYLKSP